MHTSCILGKYAGKLNNSCSVSSHHFKWYLQLKIKKKIVWGKEWEASYGRLSGKTQQKRVSLLCQLKSCPSPLIRVSRDLVIPSSWYTEGDTLTHAAFPCKYKCFFRKYNFYLVFRAFSWSVCCCCYCCEFFF